MRRRLVDALAHADTGATTPGFTAAELGAQVGLHVTTVRFHLDQLVAAGLVESAVRREGGAGRPRKVYSLAPGSLDDVDARTEIGSLRLLSGLLAQTLGDGASGTRDHPGRGWAALGRSSTFPPNPTRCPPTPPAGGSASSPR